MRPSEPSRMLVVGAGSIGQRHLRCLLGTQRAVVSFVEPNADLRQQVATQYPAATPLATFEEALSHTFDGAVVATPAPLHIPQATALLERGVHVLIEKPLSVDLHGVPALQAAAQAAGRVVGVAYVYRANPVLASMRDALRSGEFGRPVELIACGGQNFPTYRPAYRETYYTRHDAGGGAIQDALTHVLNAGQWLVGNLQRVVVDAAHQLLPGVEVEDTVHVLGRHGDVLASYTLNQHQAPNELTISVVCERGVLRFENHHHRWREMRQPDTPWIDHTFPPLERDELFIRQSHAFLAAMQGQAAPLCSLEEGIATLQVNLAALASWREACWKTVGGKA